MVSSQQPSRPDNSILAILRCERLRRIVAWLLAHEDEIAGLDRGQVTFDWSGSSVKATKKETTDL